MNMEDDLPDNAARTMAASSLYWPNKEYFIGCIP